MTMKVLMFSTDVKILGDGTDARRRMVEYGTLFEELHVVVFTTRKFPIPRPKSEIIGNVYFYPTNSRWKIARLWDAYKIAKSIIRNLKLEIRNYVISAQDPFETGIVGYMLKRKFGIPLQVQAHTDFFSPYFAAESWKNRLRVIVGRRIVRAADSVRTVSERVKRTLVGEGDVGEEKITVLPIFVDAAALRATPPASDLKKKYPQFGEIILMASRLTREKNIGLGIAATREVVKKYPHAGLVIMGEGPEREALKFKVASLKLQDTVVFEEWTNEPVSYYKGADVFLITSNYEGYGRTAVEAAACGLPVVMTDVGLAGEFIVDGFNGIVCPIGNASAVTEALVRLIEKPSLRQEMGAHHSEVLAALPSKAGYLARYKKALEGIV
ncbi:MAG: glycosyltransferase [bacterium]|nr:glycosyltransferase [bacterium]